MIDIEVNIGKGHATVTVTPGDASLAITSDVGLVFDLDVFDTSHYSNTIKMQATHFRQSLPRVTENNDVSDLIRKSLIHYTVEDYRVTDIVTWLIKRDNQTHIRMTDKEGLSDLAVKLLNKGLDDSLIFTEVVSTSII